MINNRANFDKIDDYYNSPQAKKENNSGLKTLLTLGLVGAGGYGGYRLLKKYGGRVGSSNNVNAPKVKNITSNTSVNNTRKNVRKKNATSRTEKPIENQSQKNVASRTERPTENQKQFKRLPSSKQRIERQPYSESIQLKDTKYAEKVGDDLDIDPWNDDAIRSKKITIPEDKRKQWESMKTSMTPSGEPFKFVSSRNSFVKTAKRNSRLSSQEKNNLLQANTLNDIENSPNIKKIKDNSKTKRKLNRFTESRDEYGRLLDKRIQQGQEIYKTNPYNENAFNEKLITNNLAEFNKLKSKC